MSLTTRADRQKRQRGATNEETLAGRISSVRGSKPDGVGPTQEYRRSEMSNKSPGPISRTPSADRFLLRTLTVSPNLGDFNDDGESPDPSAPFPQSIQGTQSVQHRQSTGKTVGQSQARVIEGSPNNLMNRVSTLGYGNVIDLSTTSAEFIREEWQSNKTVVQCNNYMLKNEILCDVTFAIGETKEEIRAHKYMLMCRSPVLFKSLIKHLGNMDVRIGVPDMKPDTFRDILQYIYTDEFDIHSNNVATTLYAAKKFQLEGLTSLCFAFMDAEIHDDNVAKIMEQAHIYNGTGLFEKCLRYILINGNSVLHKPSIAELCSECLSQIIKSDDLQADEEAVFEGCITWANAECRRQKKHVTDENRREVLKKLLYFVRFPIMDVTYFTQKVSMGQLLSHDEILSIFQYYHGEEQQLPNRFSRNHRNRSHHNIVENSQPKGLTTPMIRPNILRVQRFPTTDGSWKQNGPPDAISFTVSSSIVLYGVEVFGIASGKETYALNLLVYDDITREEIRKSDVSILTSSREKDKYEVYLARPLRVPPQRVFSVVVIMKGAPTHKGVEGRTVYTVDGITFEFSDSNRSSNGTDIVVGQIPTLLFNKTQ